MKNYIVIPLEAEPGIQRDGTKFASKSYIDGQWCRFYMGKPRKMGGYELIDSGNNEIITDMFVVPKPNLIDLYLGRPSSLKYNEFDLNGTGSGEFDRTPTSVFAPNVNNVWSFDLFTNIKDKITQSFIVTAAIQNGNDISNTLPGNIYYGDINSRSPLIPVTSFNWPGGYVTTSGGVLFASPFLILYGNDGIINWSTAGNIIGPGTGETDEPFPLVNTTTIANTKLVKAFRTRGSTSPQFLVWSLNSLLNVAYTAVKIENKTIGTFTPSVIQDNITVISPDSIVEYDQQFFWIGIDQFYFFNGIVQRLENSMSSDWFFNNVNYRQRSKIWGMTVPRFKEIWWFYPRGNSTQCNAVIIYNVELKVWYDSVIGRSAGVSTGIFPRPIMSDSGQVETTIRPYKNQPIPNVGFQKTYPIWQHEFGNDKIINNQSYAIESYFETNIITLFGGDPNNNRMIRSRRIEPDFDTPADSTLPMSVTVNNRNFPNSAPVSVGPFVFKGDTEKIDDVTSQGRLVSFVFSSNVEGGFYQTGRCLLDYEIGDVNPSSVT